MPDDHLNLVDAESTKADINVASAEGELNALQDYASILLVMHPTFSLL